MWWLRVAAVRLRGLLKRDAVERDMDEEFRCHIEMLVEEHLRRGLPEGEARRLAYKSFGNVGRVKERARDIKGGGVMESLLQDLRFGARLLAKSPGFTAMAVLALALGVGANTAVFSVVNGVLLKSLPYADPDHIVGIFAPSRGGRTLGLTDLEFFDFHDRNTVFEEVAVYASGATNLTGIGEPERVAATWVSSGFFPVLGVNPAIGRLIAEEDDKPDPAPVVVLSDGIWQRRFGSDPAVVGSQVSLNGITRTVIGVMPRGFQYESKEIELWLPLGLDRANVEPGNRSYNAVARLRPGVTHDQAGAEMDALAAQLAGEYKKKYTADGGEARLQHVT